MEFQVEFGRNREAWQQALTLKPPELELSDSFYEDEWEQVIQAKGVVSEQEHRHVTASGAARVSAAAPVSGSGRYSRSTAHSSPNAA